jgi:hypothetical protein
MMGAGISMPDDARKIILLQGIAVNISHSPPPSAAIISGSSSGGAATDVGRSATPAEGKLTSEEGVLKQQRATVPFGKTRLIA